MIKYSVLKMALDLDLEGLLSYFDLVALVGLVGSALLCLFVRISFSFQLLSVLKVSPDLHSPVGW